MHLILDTADVEEWTRHHAGGILVPESKRPSVLQVDGVTAEREALRLATASRSGRFVIYAPVAIAVRVLESTHVNILGEPIMHKDVVRLLPIHEDDDLPF